MWSLFGQINVSDMEKETATGVSKHAVLALYFVFLILSSIMMINILVALLTKTFDSASVSHCRHYYHLNRLVKIPHTIFAITQQSFSSCHQCAV